LQSKPPFVVAGEKDLAARACQTDRKGLLPRAQDLWFVIADARLVVAGDLVFV
jgi:hypothetical protein